MIRRRELGGESRSADELGGRIRRPQLGVALLQRGELTEQRVELPVGDDGCVPDVVAELMTADVVGEHLPLAADVGGDGVGRGIGRG